MKALLSFVFFIFASAAHALPEFDTNIPNFAQVAPGLYRGGRPSSEDLAQLAAQGVHTDLNLQGGDLNNPDYSDIIAWWEPGELPENIANEKSVAENLKMHFMNVPLSSLAAVDSDEDLAIDGILAQLANPSARPLFIHCEHGVDRTGLVIALYRVKFENWTAKDAYHEWLDMGHSGSSRLLTDRLDEYFFAKVKQFGVEASSDGTEK